MDAGNMKCLVTALILLAFNNHQVRGQVQQFMPEGQPEDVEAIAGSEVVLKCRVSNAGGSVLWTQNGFGLGTSRELLHLPRYSIIGDESLGEYDLRIELLELYDDAKYECQFGATEYMPGLRSNKAHVTVLLPPSDPEIEKGPVVSVNEGEPYNLTCSAAFGRPAPEVTWSTAGQTNISSSFSEVTLLEDRKRENVTGVLTIEPTRDHQGQRYACLVMNPALTEPKRTEVTLDVMYRPEVVLTVEPADDIREGDTVVITCQATGKPNVISWRWFEDGLDMTNLAKENQLILHDVNYGYHNKEITCQAENDVGTTPQTLKMTVLYGAIFSPALNAAVDVGQEATMKCFVEGNPAPSVRWSRKDAPDNIIGNLAELTIKDVKEDDFGVYLCTASVAGFLDAHMEVYLVENGPPVLLSEAEQSAQLEGRGYLICETHSAPKPSFMTWSRDGRPLDFNQLDRYMVQEEDTVLGRRSTIQISRVQEADFGRYNCTVENSYGHATQYIMFQKQAGVSIAFILIGAAGGVIIILVICIVIVIYQRRKHGCCTCCTGSDASSEGSEASLNKKPINDRPDIIVQYKSDIYGNPNNTLKQNYDRKYSRNSPDYDEVRYPTLPIDPRNPSLPQDYTDYGYDGPQPEYGTYPRSAPRYERFPPAAPANGVTDIYTLPNRGYNGPEFGRASPRPPSDYNTLIPRNSPTDYATVGSRPPSRIYGTVSPHPSLSDYGRISPHPPQNDYGRISPHAPMSTYRPISPLPPLSEYGPISPHPPSLPPANDYGTVVPRRPPSDYGTVPPKRMENGYGRIPSPVDPNSNRLSTNV